uniref:Integrase catalytic domain-containing protein n=1 Tax=Triticum urartu TaxID=4572 RepID=A0A8R7TK32_TRIUA
MKEIFRLHSLPLAIISDRDRIFTGHVWQELFKLCRTDLRLSSSYHPQTGQTERVNQCLEGYLRCAVHSCPRNWSKWLSLAEYWYNTSFHSALGKTPFEVIYGHLPREFGIAQIDKCAVPDLAAWLQEREVMLEHLQQQLKRAQDRMKVQADRHRTDREFAIGDAVLFKLQPFIQSSVAQRPHQKLAFRYYGPYRVLARVGAVVYKLQLPTSNRIHPVVHVSQLKKAFGATVPVSADLPPDNSISQAEHVPELVLDRKMVRVAGDIRPRIRVQWSHLPPSLSTWEDPVALQQRFPSTPPWGQVGTQAGG